MRRLTIDPVPPIAVRTGEAIGATIAASGGIPEYDFRVVRGGLPDGVTLDSFTGRLIGAPTRPGRFRCTIEVRDSDPANPKARRDVTIVVTG